jgi:putative oxidoreductase
MTLGLLALRGAIGALFVGHGTQKLFGWFGGHGLEGTGGFFESQLGLRPGKRHATAAGAAETVGGALLCLGAFTPIAAAMVSGTMVTAIRKVHGPNGPWVTESGWEYNAVLIAAMAALSGTGPGALSVDARAFPRMHGNAFALGTLAAGLAGSYLVTERFNDAPADPSDGADIPGDPAVADDRGDDGRFAGAGEAAETTTTA